MSDFIENLSGVDKFSPSVGSLHTGEVCIPSPTIICKICGEKFKDYQSLATHIRKHSLNTYEYYVFNNQNTELGICINCGTPTKFLTLSRGFRPYCSQSCAAGHYLTTNKIKETCLEKYGSINGPKNHKFPVQPIINKRLLDFPILVENLKKVGIVPLFDIDYYSNSRTNIFKFNCQLCGENFELPHSSVMVRKIKCPCFKIREIKSGIRSEMEREFLDYIQTLGIKYEVQKRFYYKKQTFYELDIYLPDYNVGIELNGVYWHSLKFKNKFHHQNKFLFFHKLGIKVFQIWEHEWKKGKTLAKSIINYRILKGVFPSYNQPITEVNDNFVIYKHNLRYPIPSNFEKYPFILSEPSLFYYDSKLKKMELVDKVDTNKELKKYLYDAGTANIIVPIGGTK